MTERQKHALDVLRFLMRQKRVSQADLAQPMGVKRQSNVSSKFANGLTLADFLAVCDTLQLDVILRDNVSRVDFRL